MKTSQTVILELAWIAAYVVAAWFVTTSVQTTAFFALGLVGGVGLLIADAAWLYRFYHARTATDSFQPLITRSVMFLAAFVLLSLFVVTSSGSILGMGLVLGLGGGLLTEMLLLRKDTAVFQAVFLSDVKMKIEPFQVTRIVMGFAALHLFLSAFVLLGI